MMVPNHLLSGGVAGIAIIFYYLAGLPIGLQMLLYNLPLLFAAYKTLGRGYTLDIAFGTGEEIIDAQHLVAVSQKLLAEVGTDEPRAPGDEAANAAAGGLAGHGRSPVCLHRSH